jgi:hypothetical protein
LGTECERREKTNKKIHQWIQPGNKKGHPIMGMVSSTSKE